MKHIPLPTALMDKNERWLFSLISEIHTYKTDAFKGGTCMTFYGAENQQKVVNVSSMHKYIWRLWYMDAICHILYKTADKKYPTETEVNPTCREHKLTQHWQTHCQTHYSFSIDQQISEPCRHQCHLACVTQCNSFIQLEHINKISQNISKTNCANLYCTLCTCR